MKIWPVVLLTLGWIALPCISSCQNLLDRQFRRNQAIVQRLEKQGTRYTGKPAIIYCDKDLLTAAELKRYGALVNRGIAGTERFLSLKFDHKHYRDRRIHVFVSEEVTISNVPGWESGLPYIFMNGERVQNQTDPYLHEIAHMILGQGEGNDWLVEGVANYIASAVHEQYGGYDTPIFDNRGNKGVDGHVRKLLVREENRKFLPQILGKTFRLDSFSTDDEVQSFRALAYPISHSFVKFLAEQVGLTKLKALYKPEDTRTAILGITGKSQDAWEKAWLLHIGVEEK